MLVGGRLRCDCRQSSRAAALYVHIAEQPARSRPLPQPADGMEAEIPAWDYTCRRFCAFLSVSARIGSLVARDETVLWIWAPCCSIGQTGRNPPPGYQTTNNH